MNSFHDVQDRSDKFQAVLDACSYFLHHSAIGQETKGYINGRLPTAAQRQFQFGYFPSNEELPRLFELVDKSLLEELLLVYPKYISGGTKFHGHFAQHNLVMPFYDAHGNIISLIGRTTLSSDEQKKQNLQKYKYSYNSNKNMYLFGFNEAKQAIVKNDCVICVEGQFDYISLHLNGIYNTVALGCANLSKYQLYKLLSYTDNVILMLDKDNAGILAKQKIKKLYSAYCNIRSLNFPGNFKDIDSLLSSTPTQQTRKFINFLQQPYADWSAAA